jgi:hypothetical protein
VPDKFRIRRFDGNALPLPATVPGGVVGGVVGEVLAPGVRVGGTAHGVVAGVGGGVGGGIYRTAQSGQIIGIVTDSSTAVLPGATIRAIRDDTVVSETTTDAAGWFLLANISSGPVTIEAALQGFRTGRADLTFDQSNARRVDFQLPVGTMTESVTVSAESPGAPALTAEPRKAAEDTFAQAPSSNVFNLQRRVAGVLPVRMDVPRAGAAYRFVRPLVLDETTNVSFEYRSR